MTEDLAQLLAREPLKNAHFVTDKGVEVWCDEDGLPVVWSVFPVRPPREKRELDEKQRGPDDTG
jgi:hypothetical protein